MGEVSVGAQRAWGCAVGVVQSVVGVVIVLPLLPVVGTVLFLLWAWRNLVLLVVWADSGRVARVASGMEALFALDSPGARAVITGVTVLKGNVSVESVRKVLAERLVEARDEKGRLLHPKFRQVVERRCGVVVWVWEENFSVESHVHQLRVDRRPVHLQDEEDILAVMSRRANQPFVRGQAKWEVLVAPLRRFSASKYDIDVEEEEEEEEWSHTVVAVRLHHALGDGRSLVGLIVTALVDTPLRAEDPRPSPEIQRPLCGGRLARASRFLWSLTHLPWVLLRVLVRGDSSVLHGRRLGGDKFLAWSPPLSLDALKEARQRAGATVNDVLLTGLAEALHKYLRVEGNGVPSQVMTVIPVDVTAPGTPLSLANRISLCTVPLPTGEMPLSERLQEVHRRINVLKASPDIMMNYFALDLLSNLLPAPLARRALNTHGVTMVSSNMPGPKEIINLFGQPVDDLMFWIPNKSRTGLGVSMLSYRGFVRCGLNVDSALIPTAEFAQELMNTMASEIENLLVEVVGERGENDSHVVAMEEEGSDLSLTVAHRATYSTDEYSDLHDGSRRFLDLDGSEIEVERGLGIEKLNLLDGSRRFLAIDASEVDNTERGLEGEDTSLLDGSRRFLSEGEMDGGLEGENHLLLEGESHQLLGSDFQNERLEIRTVVRSESNLSRICAEKASRFALSETNFKGENYSLTR